MLYVNVLSTMEYRIVSCNAHMTMFWPGKLCGNDEENDEATSESSISLAFPRLSSLLNGIYGVCRSESPIDFSLTIMVT